MRRLEEEDFNCEDGLCVVAWLDRNGETTEDEDKIVDLMVKLDSTGECCLIDVDLYFYMDKKDKILRKRVH